MKRLKYILMVIAVGCCGQTMAQGGVKAFIKKVGAKMDSMAVKGVDRRYIDAPERPWQVIVRGNVSQTIVSMNTQGSMVGMDYSAKPQLRTTPSQYVDKLKAYGYATNVEELMEDPYCWDPTTTEEEWDEWFYGKVRVTPMGDQTFNSGISIGFDARMSLTYNIGRFFLNAYGQFNNIRYSHNNTHGYLNDWFVNTSIGIRL